MTTLHRTGLALSLALGLAGCATEQAAERAPARRAPEQAASSAGEEDASPGELERRESIDRIFARKVAELQGCWQSEYERTKDRKLELTLAVQLTVAPSGKVASLKLLEARPGNPAIESCASDTIASWVFPAGKGQLLLVKSFRLGAQF